MFFVEARFHRDPGRAAGQVRYIAHREEGLTDGRRRELYGIGEQYRALRGDEAAIREALRADGRKLRNPVYFRFILTVDNPTAERFKRFDGHLSERILRDAVARTLRGAARAAQGVFAVHQHGGQNRAATLTCTPSSARGSPTEWRCTSRRCESRESRSAGNVKFSPAWNGRNGGSPERGASQRTPRIALGAIATAAVPRMGCCSRRRAADAANSSCSGPRERQCGSAGGTSG